LQEEEMQILNGGSFGDWLKTGIAWSLVSSIISNWGDIREGFSDGYNKLPPRY
jgi:hypothetical protein